MAKRASYSPAQRSKWLAQWKRSGQTAAEFGEEHGIHPSTLYQWAKRERAQGPARAAFTEVRVRDLAAARAPLQGRSAEGAIEIVTAAGHVIRVHAGVDVETLRGVLAALGPC